ncbi:MAG TPA: universal stress protein [Terriglobia bacterium]|nr:universal stress protein [Terriglobia bacterium]
MTETRSQAFAIRRILVALDASAHSLAALEAAADLAARMEAELVGLFVEDINLLRLAGLPFAQAIRRHSLAGEPFDSPGMERALRAQAAQARRALAAASERAAVKSSFRVVRGRVAAELLTAASDADLIALGKAGGSLTRNVRLGSTALALTANAPLPLLLVTSGAPRQPILAVYDATECGRRALEAAASLAEMTGSPLTVIIVADNPEAAGQLEKKAGSGLEGHPAQVRVARLPRLAYVVRNEPTGLLVVGVHGSLGEEALQRLLDAIDNPVLLIR